MCVLRVVPVTTVQWICPGLCFTNGEGSIHIPHSWYNGRTLGWALNEVDCVPVTRVVRHKKPRNLHPEFQSGFIKLAELPRTHSTVSTLGFFNFYIDTEINTSLLKAAVSSFSFTLEDFRNKNFSQRGGLNRFFHIGVSNFYVYPFPNPSPNIEYSWWQHTSIDVWLAAPCSTRDTGLRHADFLRGAAAGTRRQRRAAALSEPSLHSH